MNHWLAFGVQAHKKGIQTCVEFISTDATPLHAPQHLHLLRTNTNGFAVLGRSKTEQCSGHIGRSATRQRTIRCAVDPRGASVAEVSWFLRVFHGSLSAPPPGWWWVI